MYKTSHFKACVKVMLQLGSPTRPTFAAVDKPGVNAASTSGQENGAPPHQAAASSSYTDDTSYPSSWPPHSSRGNPQVSKHLDACSLSLAFTSSALLVIIIIWSAIVLSCPANYSSVNGY